MKVQQELNDCEGSVDLGEHSTEASGQNAHTSGGAKGDQSHDQGILDQVLTFFVVLQVEYALVVALVAFGATAGMTTLAGGLSGMFTKINAALTVV